MRDTFITSVIGRGGAAEQIEASHESALKQFMQENGMTGAELLSAWEEPAVVGGKEIPGGVMVKREWRGSYDRPF